jgi:hypothetical protein
MCFCTLQGTAAAAGLHITTKSAALLPEGGASDVGASVCKYAQEQKVRGGVRPRRLLLAAERPQATSCCWLLGLCTALAHVLQAHVSQAHSCMADNVTAVSVSEHLADNLGQAHWQGVCPHASMALQTEQLARGTGISRPQWTHLC